MFEKQVTKIYYRIVIEDLLALKTQEKINAAANKKYEETKKEWFGDDYDYYVDINTIKSIVGYDPDTGDMVVETEIEINPKIEKIEELFELTNRLVVGL